ncbi:MAG: hypothetical protein UT05_C0020G0004 [Parcubacteria group bacterium GW2011_GWF2_38_76]|nr:MAG: hypothetical protein UT05_C0020G0004 [Parcubacteria group bacterium GW2011_GWF2_38_76]HBM46048.1 hypothetical protein [Patescibacteria group bacterium]
MIKNTIIAILISIGLMAGAVMIAPDIKIFASDVATTGGGGAGQTPKQTSEIQGPCPPKPKSKPMTGGSGSGRIDKEDLRAQLTEKLKTSKLNGYVPSDGAKYGITTGSPGEWANYLTELAREESSYNNNTVGDVGLFDGNSNGLFQLSPNDAVNYRLNGGKRFTQDQLRDADTNMSAAISIHEALVTKTNSIKRGAGRYWGPVQRGWTPYIPSTIPEATEYNGKPGTATVEGDDDPCWCITDPQEKAECEKKQPTQKPPTGSSVYTGAKITPNYGGNTLWQTSPQCYKHVGNPSGPRVYYLTPTCNAGYKWEGDSLVYYPDCGYKNSVGCSEWLSRISGVAGCLWAVCKGNNAIWDPQTKKCGCDDASPNILALESTSNQKHGTDDSLIGEDEIEESRPIPQGEKTNLEAIERESATITKENTSVLIDKSEKTMIVYKDGKEISRTDINVGINDLSGQKTGGIQGDRITPTGTFTITNDKRKNTSNMGTSFIGLSATDQNGNYRGIAVHGGDLRNGELRGTYGCIRVTNQDADMFHKLPVGTKITIQN